MKRLLPVVVITVVCALLTLSFKPIPKSFDEVSAATSFNYVKFMKTLWLKPVARVKAPVRSFTATVDAWNVCAVNVQIDNIAVGSATNYLSGPFPFEPGGSC